MNELEPDDGFQHDDERAIDRDAFRDNADYLLSESYEREALEARVATLVRPARRARRRSPDLAVTHDRRSPDHQTAVPFPETFGQALVRGRETRAQQSEFDSRATRPQSKLSDTSWTRTTGILALCASLLFGLFSFVPGERGPTAATRPIELIQPGQRVLVDAPDEALAADFARLTGSELTWDQAEGGWKLEAEADPLREIELATAQQLTKADYRLVKLQARSVWEDGTVDEINVETLQPWQWLQHHEVRVGGRAPLPVDALEMGLPEELTGKVLDILPCPPLRGGPGRIVLTTVNHLNRDVIELTLCDADGRTETLRPTGTHKFYSVTRGEWLSASQLENGERLDGIDGKITVARLQHLPGTHRVYNLTVQGEHLYRVAHCGVLVHNNKCDVVSEIGIAGSSRKIDVGAPTEPPIIIGENMKRVNTYAREAGGETIDDWLAGRPWTQELNDEFIVAMKAQGREFRDIGPDLGRRLRNRIAPSQGRPPSSVYGTERRELRDYGNYSRLYDRSGRYQGGVPGFDP